MRILILGGLGYVGGRLGLQLYESGNNVFLGTRSDIKITEWFPHLSVVKINWNDKRSLTNLCNGFDVVVHAAGMNAQNCFADSNGAIDFKYSSTLNLLESAESVGVKRVIYLSTAHVYANPLVGVLNEYSPISNQHPYAVSHAAAEKLLFNFNTEERIQCLVLRISNAFGFPMHESVDCWQLLLNDMCRSAVVEKKLILRSNGSQQRDFVPMSKVCRVVNKFISNDLPVDSFPVFNLGFGKSMTVLEMAELVQKRCESILCFTPEIVITNTDRNYNNNLLDFRVDKLNAIDNNLTCEIEDEIDQLLSFCHRNFRYLIS